MLSAVGWAFLVASTLGIVTIRAAAHGLRDPVILAIGGLLPMVICLGGLALLLAVRSRRVPRWLLGNFRSPSAGFVLLMAAGMLRAELPWLWQRLAAITGLPDGIADVLVAAAIVGAIIFLIAGWRRATRRAHEHPAA